MAIIVSIANIVCLATSDSGALVAHISRVANKVASSLNKIAMLIGLGKGGILPGWAIPVFWVAYRTTLIMFSRRQQH